MRESRRRFQLPWRPVLLAALAGLAWVAAPGARAAEPYPARPIRIVVPQAPGGSADLVTRRIADRMSLRLGVPIIVDNRPGAAGAIGVEAVMRGPPDGYLLLAASTNTHAMLPHVVATVPYDPLADFAPIVDLVHTTKLLGVHAGLPVRSVQELIAYAREHSLNFGSAGIGSSNHFDMAALMAATGITMTHVPYRGAAAAGLAVASGEVQVLLGSPTALRPQIDAGKVRPIAVFSKARLPSFPDVPTLREAGYADLDLTTWIGLVAPAGTPAPILDRLNALAREVLAEPDFVAWARSNEMEIAGGSRQVFATLMHADYARWGRIAGQVGIAASVAPATPAGAGARGPRP
jgi:tripartite-type tricarboxylate transporter receptor subunit TctC